MKPARKKIDARARIALEEGELTGPLDVVVRTEATPSGTDLARLASRGLTVGTCTGNVLTGRIAADQLLHFAALPIVEEVEVSRPLYAEYAEVES